MFIKYNNLIFYNYLIKALNSQIPRVIINESIECIS